MASKQQVERWDVFEVELKGTDQGNPFKDIRLEAAFMQGHRKIHVDGFYDGEGTYRIRFMPDELGEWTYQTKSNSPELDGISGTLLCSEASEGNHGPVRVHGTSQFRYEDGTPYHPYGTTCYVWTHQSRELQGETLRTLAQTSFNKIRMCVFPKNYAFNSLEPALFPFAGNSEKGFDLSRFNPDYFANLEQRIVELGELGIEVDLILFHPYDKGRWGFDRMDSHTDDYYLRYVIARLSAYRNIWWSLANEYDFMEEKTMEDWDRLFKIVQTKDPYQHLRSIHNGTKMYDFTSVKLYDHGKPWVTHVSIQHWDMQQTLVWRKLYKKPIVVDECGYEGNLHRRWGNLTAEEMTKRFWEGVIHGGYVSHGESFMHPEDIIWWSHGGKLHGKSPERIGFLRKLMEDGPENMDALDIGTNYQAIGIEGEYYLYYFGQHQPALIELQLPAEHTFKAEIIDTWNMTIEEIEGEYSGPCQVQMPGTSYQALRLQRI